MIRTVLLFVVALLLQACEKKQGTDTPRYYAPTTTDTVNYIQLTSLNLTNRFDTTAGAHNRVKEYEFSLAPNFQDTDRAVQLKGHYFVSPRYNFRNQKIRYTGLYELLNKDSIISRTDNTITYTINDLLKGKPLFEVYYADTNLVSKRVIASGKTVWINVSYNADNTTPSSTITSAFQHFLQPEIASQSTYITFYHRLD